MYKKWCYTYLTEMLKCTIQNNFKKSGMYDKYSGIQIINLGEYTFESSRYEVWTGGQMVKSASIPTSISLKTIGGKIPSLNVIEISLSTFLPESLIAHKMSFDISYTGTDRILVTIVAANTNCEDYDSYKLFRNLSPTITRQEKLFKINEPYACSIFSINNIPDKITFAVPLSKLLIEFYSK